MSSDDEPQEITTAPEDRVPLKQKFAYSSGLVADHYAQFGVAWLAWWPATELAVNPIVPRADGVAVPPQLVPPDVLTRAGFDDRGRPIKPER